MKIIPRLLNCAAVLCITLTGAAYANDGSGEIQLGPRPFYLVDDMDESALKNKLKQCENGPFYRTEFSISHRGAPLQFPEHSEQSYRAAGHMGAGIIECDVTFTKDRELVCRHSQCDLHKTTNILTMPEIASSCSAPFVPANAANGTEASAKCCTSDITLSQFRQLKGKMDSANKNATTVEEYLGGGQPWRTELYATNGKLMTFSDSIELFKELGVKMTPELKAPQVKMPFEGDFTQQQYAQKMVDTLRDANVEAGDVFLQSFNIGDIEYWVENEPAFGAQAILLESRGRQGLDPEDPSTWNPSMQTLYDDGVRYIGPPLWMLVKTGPDRRPVPSAYAIAAKEAGLKIITWSLERSGPLAGGGGYYYQSIKDITNNDGDMMVLVDVLAKEVGVAGIFSDWPATVTYYANCNGL